MITVETNIPAHCVAPKQLFNPSSNNLANLGFHKFDWPNILLRLQSIDWVVTLEPIPPPSCFDYFIDNYIINECIMFPQKFPVKPIEQGHCRLVIIIVGSHYLTVFVIYLIMLSFIYLKISHIHQ